ncbi:MAG: hypothetical protein ACXWX5_08595 [Actinomycetota bacterium]
MPSVFISASLIVSFENNGRPSSVASARAIVVFPLPGGPDTMTYASPMLSPIEQILHQVRVGPLGIL